MAAQLEHVKWIPGTRFIVDGFRFPSSKCQHYFLTHAHADHTTGLKKAWSAGTIYCTPVTAKLIIEEQSIPQKTVAVVPFNEPFWLEGVRITALCANHCPGACMFLFQTPLDSPSGTQKFHSILHTGDFRYNARMPEYPELQSTSIHTLMLDTTYSTPRWSFPAQQNAIAEAIKVVEKTREESPETVFAFNAYHIGKERCYFQVASSLHMTVWVSSRRLRTLRRLALPDEWLQCIIANKKAADVIVSDSGVGPPQLQQLQKELDRPVIGFLCTGWGFSKTGVKKRKQDGTVSYSIPYSEHSSWDELRACVKAFRPKKLIPTVNVSDTASFDRMIAKFADLMDLSESKKHIDRFFVTRRSQLGMESGLCSAKSPANSETFLPLACSLCPKSCETTVAARGKVEQYSELQSMSCALKRPGRAHLEAENSLEGDDYCELVDEDCSMRKCSKQHRALVADECVLDEDSHQSVVADVCEIFDI